MVGKAAIQEKLREARETGRAKVLQFEEEAQKLLNRIAEKGRDAQAEGRRRLEGFKAQSPLKGAAPLVDRVKDVDFWKRITALRTEVEERLDGGVDKRLLGFGVASRVELEKLQKRLEALSARVGELAKVQKKAAKESRVNRPAGPEAGHRRSGKLR